MTPPRPPAIVAASAVIDAWRKEHARAAGSAKRVGEPWAVASLATAPREVRELVAYLAAALSHAAAIFLASAANAAPPAPGLLAANLRALVGEVVAEQAGATGGRPAPCPIPEEGGAPHMCTCGPKGRRVCAETAFDIGICEVEVPITEATLLAADATARAAAAQLDADLDALIDEDRARRDGLDR